MEPTIDDAAKEDVGILILIAGDSSPAIASFERRIISAGLNAGGEKGDVKGGNILSASLVVDIALRCTPMIVGGTKRVCWWWWEVTIALLCGSCLQPDAVTGTTLLAAELAVTLDAKSCDIIEVCPPPPIWGTPWAAKAQLKSFPCWPK